MFLRFLLSQETPKEAKGCDNSTYLMLGILVVVMIVIFVLPMITNRKRGKQVNDMRTTLRVGDEIMTIGGIVGKVIKIIEKPAGEKDFVIESGVGENRSTMTFDMRALHENRTRVVELREEAAKQAEIDRIKKEQKKLGNKDEAPTSEEPTEADGTEEVSTMDSDKEE